MPRKANLIASQLSRADQTVLDGKFPLDWELDQVGYDVAVGLCTSRKDALPLGIEDLYVQLREGAPDTIIHVQELIRGEPKGRFPVHVGRIGAQVIVSGDPVAVVQANDRTYDPLSDCVFNEELYFSFVFSDHVRGTWIS